MRLGAKSARIPCNDMKYEMRMTCIRISLLTTTRRKELSSLPSCILHGFGVRVHLLMIRRILMIGVGLAVTHRLGRALDGDRR